VVRAASNGGAENEIVLLELSGVSSRDSDDQVEDLRDCGGRPVMWLAANLPCRLAGPANGMAVGVFVIGLVTWITSPRKTLDRSCLFPPCGQ